MTIKEADCDSCGTDIRPQEGDELFSFKDGIDLCRKCYNERFEDMVILPEDDEE